MQLPSSPSRNRTQSNRKDFRGRVASRGDCREAAVMGVLINAPALIFLFAPLIRPIAGVPLGMTPGLQVVLVTSSLPSS